MTIINKLVRLTYMRLTGVRLTDIRLPIRSAVAKLYAAYFLVAVVSSLSLESDR